MREIGRVAVGYRSIRALRWIGFSEDDAQTIAEGARFALPEHRVHQKLGGKAAFNFNNALSRLRALNERWIDFSEDDAFSRGCGNKMTPCEVHVFEEKIQISFKKSVNTISRFQLNSALLSQDYEGK